MEHVEAAVIRQHLIDPEICIRCNTCEATCPVGAITHDARNYVVDAGKCDLCMACIPPCPTGSIDNWRVVPRADAYGVEAQFGWDSLPAELSPGISPPRVFQPSAAIAEETQEAGRDAAPPARARSMSPTMPPSSRPGPRRTPTPISTDRAPPKIDHRRQSPATSG